MIQSPKLMILLLLFLGCKESKQENPLFNALFYAYVLEDALDTSAYFSQKMIPYYYSEPEYLNGLEIPEEWNLYEPEIMSVDKLRRIFNGSIHFLPLDTAHIKQQIENSKNLANTNRVVLPNVSYPKLEELPEHWYSFYVPIFNSDSSAVYVQYNYHDGIFGTGSGAILVKQQGNWTLVKWNDRWMTEYKQFLNSSQSISSSNFSNE
jgi:hypothetical protein